MGEMGGMGRMRVMGEMGGMGVMRVMGGKSFSFPFLP